MEILETSEGHYEMAMFYNIINYLKKHHQQFLYVLNCAPTNDAKLHLPVTDGEMISYPDTSQSNADFINQEIDRQFFDIILGIDYPLLEHCNIAIAQLVERIASHSLISIYKFSSFQTYFANPFFKKIYRYREVIPTSAKTIYVFCSNQYWYANGDMAMFELQTKLTRERVGTASGVRRYYFGSGRILKYYELNGDAGDHIKREIQGEARFLKEDNAKQGFAPKLLDFNINEHEGWLLRENAPGITLSEIMDENKDYDSLVVFENTLQQVILLENKNLIHIKLRPRNIIVLDAGGSLLIDYGAITHIHKQKFYLSGYYGFIMLSYEIFHKKHLADREFSPVCLIDADLHPHYRCWLKLILSQPPRTWNFKMFAKLFSEAALQEDYCKIDFIDLQHWLQKTQLLIDSNKVSLVKFESLVTKKLASYFKANSVKNRVVNFIWQQYDKLQRLFAHNSRA